VSDVQNAKEALDCGLVFPDDATEHLVHQFTSWLGGLPTDRDVALNLLAGEWRFTAI